MSLLVLLYSTTLEAIRSRLVDVEYSNVQRDTRRTWLCRVVHFTPFYGTLSPCLDQKCKRKLSEDELNVCGETFLCKKDEFVLTSVSISEEVYRPRSYVSMSLGATFIKQWSIFRLSLTLTYLHWKTLARLCLFRGIPWENEPHKTDFL